MLLIFNIKILKILIRFAEVLLAKEKMLKDFFKSSKK